MSGVAVLLAGSDDRSMLATARAFGARGIPFRAVGLSRTSAMGTSRHLRPRMAGTGPDARSEPEAYVDFLLDVVKRHRLGAVFPLTDRTLHTCVRFRDTIEAQAVLIAPPTAAVRNVLDKKANLAIARRLGIPCPDEFELERMEQLPEAVATLGFPMILKSAGPSVDGRRKRLDLPWTLVRDEAELRRRLEACAKQGVFPLVQRRVIGMSYKLCCFASAGEVLCTQVWKNVRTWRGYSVYRVTTPLSAELGRYVEALLGELEWDGLAHLEFFVADDGDVRYMETNGRPWAHVESSIALGWDFPVWAYDYFTEGRKPHPPSAGDAYGRKARWHYGDLEVLLDALRGREEPSLAGRGRARAVADYLSGFSSAVHPDVFRWDDPIPELAEHGRVLRRVGRRLTRRRAP